MDAIKVFTKSEAICRQLCNRLEIQLRGARDKEHAQELRQQMAECATVGGALLALREAYGPIIQSSIIEGAKGHKHRVVVESFDEGDEDTERGPVWYYVCAHEFEPFKG